MPLYYYQDTGTATTLATSNVYYRYYITNATNTSTTTPSYFASNAAPRRGLDDVRAQQRREQAAELLRHKEEAQQRARALLIANLSKGQRETFEKNKWFVVEGGKSKKQYRIRAEGHLVANVEVLGDGGRVDHKLCAHCEIGAVPLGDHLLAQKLLLELSEDDFLRRANRHAA